MQDRRLENGGPCTDLESFQAHGSRDSSTWPMIGKRVKAGNRDAIRHWVGWLVAGSGTLRSAIS